MYLSIPDSFFIQVCYAKDILNIRELVLLRECNGHRLFINRKDIVMGVSLPTQRENRWVRDKETMEAYAKEINVTVKIENADYDINRQISQVENLISQGIDVLILASIDIASATNIVETAHKAEIKVIRYDGLLKNVDFDLYISFNNIKVGELQGKYLITKVPMGNYIIMSGDSNTEFKQGAMEYIQPLAYLGSIKIVADKEIKDWEPKIAFKVVEDVLATNNNKVDAILAPNDAIAGAAIEALQEQGLAGKVAVTGQDGDLEAVRRIMQGTQSMTVFKDTRELAKTAIDAAIKLVNGETIITDTVFNNGKREVPTILISPLFVDKNNIYSVLIYSGYLKKEDIYKI